MPCCTPVPVVIRLVVIADTLFSDFGTRPPTGLGLPVWQMKPLAAHMRGHHLVRDPVWSPRSGPFSAISSTGIIVVLPPGDLGRRRDSLVPLSAPGTRPSQGAARPLVGGSQYHPGMEASLPFLTTRCGNSQVDIDAHTSLMNKFVEDICRAVAHGDLPQHFRPEDVGHEPVERALMPRTGSPR